MVCGMPIRPLNVHVRKSLSIGHYIVVVLAVYAAYSALYIVYSSTRTLCVPHV